MNELLRIEDLHTQFHVHGGTVKAVDGVNLTIPAKATVGLVGESGSGKSITALSIMRLLEKNGRITAGHVWFRDRDLVGLTEEEMRDVRGNDVSMIFQEPMTALNPVYTCGDQIAEAVRLHEKVEPKAAFDRAIEVLRLVGISDPKRRARQYPHELSGGMRQRVMIAMALSTNPELLIADEPTTALDVTIQAQILRLMRNLKGEFGSAILLITHDLGVVAEMCDSVAVMYAGRIVEQASTTELFTNPKHPYTQGLLASIPRLGKKQDRLHVITGSVPNPLALPPGCAFRPRCPVKAPRSESEIPALKAVGAEHLVACWQYE
ncbi:MAG: ABC transporter ATP-binding protein [Chloroflexi bacterium]|nr:MAG: ABC transporter ATP-binding protein [Chloroflexota bacterium]